MRVRLTLLATESQTLLPFNYNYAVASLIYKTIGQASSEYAQRLHDEGYTAEHRSQTLYLFENRDDSQTCRR